MSARAVSPILALALASALGAQTPADSAFPAMPPRLAPPPTVALPAAVERTLSNGLRLLVVEHHELPVADVRLVVGTGGDADPPNRAGLATLTAALLAEGTTTRGALAIADQSSFLGARLDASASWDLSTVTLHTPTAQLDSALALFADVVTRPSFPARELARAKAERLTALLQLRDDPTAIADRAFGAALYGASHPYGRPLGGSEPATRATTRADVVAFWRTHYRPNNATLIVVGDVTADDAARRAERAFGRWARAAVPPPVTPAAPARRATSVVIVDKPGAPQTSVRVGLVGVPRATDDYFAIEVMNTLLGGGFTSRLMQNLREAKGYTYGVRSGFAMRRGAGPFQVRTEVTGAKTDSALIEVMRELRAIADTVPAAELERAKRYLQLQLPSEFETTGGIGALLAPLVVHGLPLGHYDSYVQRVEQVTQADVQRVARRYLDTGRLLVVVVGDRASIEPAVRALNLGPVSVRHVTEVMGR